MRDALLADLSELPYKISTTIDARVKSDALRASINEVCRPITQGDKVWDIWADLIKTCYAVLVIAPETDGILLRFAELTKKLGKIWLGCSVDAIEVTSNKLKTYEFLKANNVPVPTFTWQSFCDYENKYPNTMFEHGSQFVAKPIDGAGCEDTYVFDNIEKLTKFMQSKNRLKTHIIQFFCKGTPASFVMLCANNQTHVLCCNKQMMQQKDHQILFKGVEINGFKQHWPVFDRVAQHLASKMPGLHGLVGVDVVVSEKAVTVIEINPRLTTSYVGLHRAMGVNPAQLLLESATNANFVMPKISQKVVTVHV